MPTMELELPQLSGGARRAAALIEASGLPESLSGKTIVVDCRQLLAGTESFAEKLLQVILNERDAEKLRAVNVDEDFARVLAATGEYLQVGSRLEVIRAA